MSILDDAIREHLALKRARGADEAELKRLEEEAFGPPRRPDEDDPFAEAPTEFLGRAEEAAPAPEPGGRRVPNIADLQEAPPLEPRGEAAAVEEQPAVEQEASPQPPAEAEASQPADTSAEQPEDAGDAPEGSDEPPADAPAAEGPNTEERQAIAEQPTQFFDVEAELGAAEDTPPVEPPEAAEPPAAPEQPAEPASAPDDLAEPADAEPAFDDEEDDDFWSEQRLSDELDRALEAPITDEELLPGAAAPAAPDDAALEQDEEPEAGADLGDDEATALYQLPVDDEPVPAEENLAPHDAAEDTEDDEPHASYEPDTGHEDVLEDTPEFLEDAPEDDELWFEQRPPKDFDFDD